MEKREVNIKNEKKNNTEGAKNNLNPGQNSGNASSATNKCGPIAQTSPGTERGGGEDKVRKNHPQPSPRNKTNKPGTHQAETAPDPTTRKTSRSRTNHATKSRKTSRKNEMECSREAKANYPRWRLEIRLRYAGSPSKHASQANLQTPRSPYSFYRSRVARLRKRKLDRSRVVQKSNQIYSIR